MRRAIILLAVSILSAACSGSSSPTAPTVGAETYTLPVRVSQTDGSGGMLVWPYGVRANDHPNGHPGIDFFLTVGADILADQAGTITEISSSTYAGEIGIVLAHDGGWQTFLTGYFTRVNVSKGQRVTQGQVVAQADRFGGASSLSGPASIHWGIVDGNKTASCPADFVPADLRAQMQRMLDQSNFPEKSQFPLLCNPCPSGGCR